MRAPDITLPAYYIRQIADQIGSMGADTPHWLARSGLSEAQLGDASLTIPLPTFRKLLVDAISLTREPALGLLVGERLLANTHGLLSYAAMNSGSIRQAIEMVELYIPLRANMVSVSHEEHGRELYVRFTETLPLGDIRRPVLEAVVLAVKNVIDFISMGTCRAQQATFPFDAPDDAGLARSLFKCEVRHGQSWAGFTLPLDVIDLPLKMADPATFQHATLICQHELEKLTRQESFSARIRRLMLEKQNGIPSLQVTARLFHLTPRTLHRRLQEEGTSFKQILEEVHHMLAVEYLRSGHMSVQEIAYTLGYTDMANFRRAFKRWESITPSVYRFRNSPDGLGRA